MVDREDIDALLIGALYGELTPAEEARLAAHLASHPADRSALADLTDTRSQLHASRILQVQLEPPGSVSALLLQEAARRAPQRLREEGEGWFGRFVRSFMMHPAIAAAAMLVVVVGAAAMISSRSGSSRPEMADTSVALSSKAPAAAPAMAPTPTQPAPQGAMTGGAAGSAMPAPIEQYQVALEEGLMDSAAIGGGGAPARKPSEVDARATTGGDGFRPGAGTTVSGEKKGRAEGAATMTKQDAAGPRGGIELRSPAAMPKDFDDGDGDDKSVAQEETELANKEARSVVGAAGAPAAIAPAATTPAAPTARPDAKPTQQYSAPPPAPPPPAKTASRDRQAAPAEPTPTTAPTANQATVDPKLAWARKQHASAIAAARADRCADAAALASSIATQVPAYYEQNVASDRALKSCVQYIAAERQKAEERARAARAKTAADTK